MDNDNNIFKEYKTKRIIDKVQDLPSLQKAFYLPQRGVIKEN